MPEWNQPLFTSGTGHKITNLVIASAASPIECPVKMRLVFDYDWLRNCASAHILQKQSRLQYRARGNHLQPPATWVSPLWQLMCNTTRNIHELLQLRTNYTLFRWREKYSCCRGDFIRRPTAWQRAVQVATLVRAGGPRAKQNNNSTPATGAMFKNHVFQL